MLVSLTRLADLQERPGGTDTTGQNSSASWRYNIKGPQGPFLFQNPPARRFANLERPSGHSYALTR
jgi:hypothetical protein